MSAWARLPPRPMRWQVAFADRAVTSMHCGYTFAFPVRRRVLSVAVRFWRRRYEHLSPNTCEKFSSPAQLIQVFSRSSSAQQTISTWTSRSSMSAPRRLNFAAVWPVNGRSRSELSNTILYGSPRKSQKKQHERGFRPVLRLPTTSRHRAPTRRSHKDTTVPKHSRTVRAPWRASASVFAGQCPRHPRARLNQTCVSGEAPPSSRSGRWRPGRRQHWRQRNIRSTKMESAANAAPAIKVVDVVNAVEARKLRRMNEAPGSH